MPLPKKQICKSLKQLSLNFANQNFAMFYERYNKFYGEERIGSLLFSLYRRVVSARYANSRFKV